MEKNNGKVAIAIVAMFVVALSIIGVTYAYFVANVVGNTAQQKVEVTAGVLKIAYNGGTELEAHNIVPGWESDGHKFYDPVCSVKTVGTETQIKAVTDDQGTATEDIIYCATKAPGATAPVSPVAFSVENTESTAGTPAYYGIVLDIETNTIVDDDNFKVTLTSDAGNGSVAVDEVLAKSGTQSVSSVISISKGDTHNFTVSAEYANISEPQTQGKAVNFSVRVVGLNNVDGKYLDYNGVEFEALN